MSKDNEIGVLKKKLKMQDVEVVQTVELRQVQKEKDKVEVALLESKKIQVIQEIKIKTLEEKVASLQVELATRPVRYRA